MADYDFEANRSMLVEQYGDSITEQHVMSHAQYPAVFKEFMDNRIKYGQGFGIFTCFHMFVKFLINFNRILIARFLFEQRNN